MISTLNKIRKLKITTYLLILLITNSMISCDKSVLSDVEINDPSLIKMEVHISQDSDTELFVDVVPRDKKHRFLRFQNGVVTVNGKSVPYKKTTIHDWKRAYRYKAQKGERNFNITVRYNSTDSYSFKYGTDEGFPGFGTEKVKEAFPDGKKEDYLNIDSDFFEWDGIPFRKGRIWIYYKVYKSMDEM